MNLWTDAFDSMNAVDLKLDDNSPLDVLLKVAEIKALLAIGQELSKIHHEGINPQFSPGE